MYIVKIDGEEITVTQVDIDQLNISLTKNKHHVLSNNKAYLISDIATEPDPKTGNLNINDSNFSFEIMDEYDQLVASMGLDKIATTKSTNIIAPMPGLILDIMVQEGDELEEGASVLILEAMKMENVIKAEGAGTVVSVNFAVGDTVDKNQLIIEVE